MTYQYGVNCDVNTNLILKHGEGKESLLCFGTKEAKKAYVRMLKGKGLKTQTEVNETPPDVAEGLEQPEPVLAVSCGITEEQLQKLRRMGWLRDEPTEEKPEMVKPKLGIIPIPLQPHTAQTKAPVVVKGRRVIMGNLLSGILGYLTIQFCKEEEVGTELERIQKLSKEQAMEELDGVLKYHGESLDIVAAILNTYSWALEADEKLVDALLRTDTRILQYHTEKDQVLGMAKDFQTYKGKNLVGHVLMSLRAELGGKQDPRIELVRGKREYSIAELNPDPNTEEGLKRGYALAQAQVFLGKRPNSESAGAKWDVCRSELVDFILGKEWWPFPSVEEFVLVGDNSGEFIARPLTEWLQLSASLGTQYIGAKEHSTLGGSYLEGVETIRVGTGEPVKTISYVLSRDSHKVHLYLRDSSEWWTWFLSEQSAKLTPEDLAELTRILSPVQLVGGCEGSEANGHMFHIWSGSEEYSWNFGHRIVDARQTRKAFGTIIIQGKPVSSNWTLVWLALQCVQNMKGVNGVLADLTNLWEREANYGHRWEETHPTKRIRDNSGAPLVSYTDYDCFNQATIRNGKFTYELFQNLVASPEYRHDCYVDKNGMKLMAGNGAGAAALTSIQYSQEALDAFEALDAGCNPLVVLALILKEEDLFTGMVEVLAGTNPALIIMRQFGYFVTANDGAKVAKFLNRAQQGGSWSEAYAWIVWKGKTWKRSESALQILEQAEQSWVPATAQDRKALLDSLFSS